jgi:Meckel syndrome type 1 protein
VLRLMKKAAAERFQSAAAVADALRPFCPGYAAAPSPAAANFSLAPDPAEAPAAPPPAPPAAAPRSLRLKVSQANRVPPPRSENTPTSDSFGRPPRTPAAGSPARPRLTPKPPPDELDDTPRFLADEPTPETRPGRPRRPVRQKRPVWPLVAAGVGSVVLLAVVAVVVSQYRPPAPPTPPTPAQQPDRPPAPAAPLADPVADGATAVLTLRPKPVVDRLPAAGRLGQLVREWAAQSKFDPARLDRVIVSLVGGSPPHAVAAGAPDGQIGTDPTLTAAVAARRASGRPATGMSADLQAARLAAGDAPLATFAAGGSFALPGGETLAQNRLSWAAAIATLDGDQVAVTLTLVGPDRQTLMEFVSLGLATKLSAEVPAVKPVCDKLAAAEPTAKRTDAGYEMTFRFRVGLAEVFEVVERLLAAPSS